MALYDDSPFEIPSCGESAFAADHEALIRFQSAILEAVALGRDGGTTIDQICLLGEEMVTGAIATVMLLDEQGLLNIRAAPSASREMTSRLCGLRPGPESGSCGNAIYRREPVFVSDALTDPRWQSLRKIAEEFSLGSCWSMPVLSRGGKAVGTFALTGFESRMPSPFQKRLMEIAASMVAIVLESEKQAEALLKSNEKFQLLFEEATDCKMLLSEEGRILDVNRIGHERLGYAKEEMVGRLAADFVTPENIDKVAQRLARVRKEGHATYSSAQMRKDGSVMPIEISTIVIELDGREIYYSILRDITKRREMEHALKKSEARLRDIFEHAPIGLAIVSLEGRFMEVNHSLCSIAGYEKEELEKLTFQEITHPDDLASNLENMNRLLSEEIPFYKMEKRYIRKDGSSVWIQLTSSLLCDEQGAPLHFIAQIEDISERMTIQEQLHHLAYHDLLTDLPNRLFLVERLEWALVQAKRHVRSLAIMFLDLDRFKLVNDRLGHDIGDKLLQVVATRLISCVRKGDIVSRQGGDEFIIVLTEIARPEDAVLVAEKIIESVGLPIEIGPHRIAIGTSIGIAVYPVDGHDDARELMKKADQAMYDAKESGRNDYRFFAD